VLKMTSPVGGFWTLVAVTWFDLVGFLAQQTLLLSGRNDKGDFVKCFVHYVGWRISVC